jgi:hypothetical protein
VGFHRLWLACTGRGQSEGPPALSDTTTGTTVSVPPDRPPAAPVRWFRRRAGQAGPAGAYASARRGAAANALRPGASSWPVFGGTTPRQVGELLFLPVQRHAHDVFLHHGDGENRRRSQAARGSRLGHRRCSPAAGDLARGCAVIRRLPDPTTLQSAVVQPEAVQLPIQDLELVPLPVTEDEQGRREGVQVEPLLD